MASANRAMEAHPRVGFPGGEFVIMFAYLAVVYSGSEILVPPRKPASASFAPARADPVPAMALAFAAAPIIGREFGAGRWPAGQAGVQQILVAVTAVMIAVTVIAQ